MFTKKQLAQWREQGFEFNEFHDMVAVEEKEKELSIQYIRCNSKNGTLYLDFGVTSKNLDTNKAIILVGVKGNKNLFSSEVSININGKTKQVIYFSLYDTTVQSWIKNNAILRATIVCDGQTSMTNDFHIKIKDNEFVPANSKLLLEVGTVTQGYWIIEDGAMTITNDKYKKNYDSVYADEPSNEKMEANEMTKYDTLVIDHYLSYSENTLKSAMEIALRFVSENMIGDSTGADLANHFFYGRGRDYTFSNDSNLVKEIKKSSEFEKFLNSLKEELFSRFNENYFVNKEEKDKYSFKTTLPNYPIQKVINPNKNEVAGFIGGIQVARVFYRIYKIDGDFEVLIDSVIFYDTFGAGWEDGGAGDGYLKQWAPGLLEMFCLQHFKNATNKDLYRPFTIALNIQLNE